MTPDLINGLFEIVGAALMTMDIVRIRRDRGVLGIYWPSRIFFLAWGSWNCFFYPYYGHWWSFVGGVAMTLVNFTWLAHVIYYRRLKPTK